MCGLWEAWFRNSWRNLQAFYGVEPRPHTYTDTDTDTHSDAGEVKDETSE